MCSYNLLNGSYTSENEHLLHDILRDGDTRGCHLRLDGRE